MAALVCFLVIIFPWTVLSFYFLGRLVLPGLVVSIVICALGLAFLILGRYHIYAKRDAWTIPFLFFLAIGCLSMALSPYREEIFEKGVIQVVGIGIALVSCMVIVREIERNPPLIVRVARLLSISLGILGWIGILQFAVFNTIGLGSLFDFSFLNSWFGAVVWRYPGEIGGLHRANSLASEPAHLARYLLCAGGIALIRFGVLGAVYRAAAKAAMPMWSAIGVIGGTLATLSLLAYLGLVIIAASCWLLSHRLKTRVFVGATFSVAVTAGVIIGLASYAGHEFVNKAVSVTLIADVGVERGELTEGIGAGQLSALAVASNVAVMVDNFPRHPLLGVGLGGHPALYERYAPPYARYSEDLEGLNAQDAGSLLVRLLSETGIAGTFLFLVGTIGLLFASRKAVLNVTAMEGRWWTVPRTKLLVMRQQLIAIAIGLAAGWAGVLSQYLLRAGQYYEQAMWVPIALVAVTPYLLRRPA